MKKTLISLLLVLSMLLSCALPAFAVEATAPAAVAESTQEPITLGETDIPYEGEVATGVAPNTELPTAEDGVKVETPSDGELTLNPTVDHNITKSEGYAAEDEVTFIVVLNTRPLLKAGFTTDDIANATKAVTSYQAVQEKAINTLSRSIRAEFGTEAEIGFTYTIATTGLSVRTAYGNRAALEAMEGVDYVYVAPTFSLPETETELTPSTSNAGSMVGGTFMNETGFTGKGMKVAIVDTGLRVNHPNFAELPEDALTETSLTRDGVEEIWETLNASKMTNMLNTSYKSSKVPFAFNYVTGNFDVDNSYAGSDHGTHVAGIAAANKIEGSDVVGVAPDAQVVVMQVFSSSGGAGWDPIMAALEDAVRLNVDTVNLSLGSASGYTDPQNETGKGFLEVLSLYLNSDINVIIAAGNDTNNAYGNLWGLNMSLSGNPDIGLAGTPSTYSAALSVASVDNDAKSMFWFEFDGKEVGFTDTATTSATRFSAKFAQGEELTYVAVPGTGAPEDYEGLDVTGKVALVQRGSLSFPDKQANAQAAGAIAIIVYDNVYGAVINMQINDGGKNIPAIFIQKADGDAMAALGTGTFTVGDGSQKNFNVTRTVSDFSSWGVTPDLKLKPEIAGVGGNVYSTVDPNISGSYYGTMSGTSMASPNVAGAMTVLMQYLRETYGLEGGELRRVSADLMMSTADPLLQGTTEYSPRAQGAGLVDLETAVKAGAYLSNAAAYEGRPKAEFGDDPERTGVYEFSFQINNMQSASKTYTLDASVLTETLYADMFIANQSYALDADVTFYQASELESMKYDFNHDGVVDTADARVLLRHINNVALIAEDDICYPYIDVNADGSVNKDDVDIIVEWCAGLEVEVDLTAKISTATENEITTITVGPDETVTVNVRIALTDEDKAYMAAFENGIYVEGFIYVNADEDKESMNMPFIGFYGDWSDAPIFDSENEDEASLGAITVATNSAYLGTNPYLSTGRSGDEYNAFSYSNPLYLIDVGVLRNIRDLKVTATDLETGDVYYNLTGSYLTKSYYMSGYGYINTMQFVSFYGEVWDGKVYADENDVNGSFLPDGTKVRYEIQGWLDDGDDIMDDSFGFDVTIDDSAPVVHNQFTLDESVSIRESDSHILLTLNIEENEHVAAVIFLDSNGNVMGKYETVNTPGVAEDFTYDITGYGSDFTIVVADYACNENEFDVSLDLGEYTDAAPAMAELSKDRLYGCETFNGAAIEGGWFSVNKADFSDLKNETFDSSKRYYSGEYVNGYVIAQSASTGHLELITPTGTYWKTQTIAENRGNVGEYGVWVLYDMALDHSGTLSTALGRRNSEESPEDSLLAVGWYYMGDQDNNGKDDGYNALFMVNFSEWGNYVEAVARIVGTDNGAEILTFAISTEGVMYGISTDGKLYTIDPTVEDDEDYNTKVVRATYVGTTDFVNYSGYGGVNVIQSMCWDHNTGKLYWFAHSQVASGGYYNNYNVTYEVNPETAACTVLGTYGPGGQTASFVPNDLESDLFTLGVQATSFSINPNSVVLAKTQTKRLSVSWQPWNAAASEITWASDNEEVATVDAYGKITAIGEGTATISATAECMLSGYWDTSSGSWEWVEGGLGDYTATCTVTVVPSQDELYGFIINDFSTSDADLKWISYSDTMPTKVTDLGQSMVPSVDADGNETMTAAMWAGGAYYNGYVYTVMEEQRETDGSYAVGTGLYKSKVTKTEEGTTIGEPEFIGFQESMSISAMAFDYTTSRMYCTENKYIGGLGIIDLDTGLVDMLGQPNGDLSGAVYIPALAVTADGTLVVSDAVADLYTMNPDTLTTKLIYTGNGDANSAYYEGMFYDHETGNIYWNMCDGTGASPLYLVRLPEYEGGEATVVDLGSVSSKKGVQQTVIFTIPENEPEAKLVPVEGIEITNGDSITGLLGGGVQLNTVTTPSRPTIRTRTWTSSDESVVTVDREGNIKYVGLGTATITVSITNKDEDTYGGPFTDSIEVTVKEAAGEFVAFLNADEDGGSQYYDFWIRGNDYDLRHTKVEDSMIAVYSLRTGAYYDGYYYAVNSKGAFMRINPSDPANYKILGTVNLDYNKYQLCAMAMDYTTGTMYGLTLPSSYDFSNWTKEEHPGDLVTINMDNGQITTVATLDFSTPVYALTCDANGQLYAAGGSVDEYESDKLYKLDKETGTLTEILTMDGLNVYTGSTYYGNIMWNTQMTYDFGTNRIYLYATTHSQYSRESYGMYMVELDGETPVLSYLDGMSMELSRGSIKYGKVYLGFLAFIPEAEEVPVGKVNGIILDKSTARIEVGGTAQVNAQARPSNAADTSLSWSSDDETIATVSETGLITGHSAGSTVITVTSNETGVTATCDVTVVSLDGPQPTAYTVSANKDALISFNPNLPAQTVETITTLSGGTSIKGMAYGDDCLYYLMVSGWSYYLYRYDLTTKQTSTMGQLYLFTEPTGLAYDPAPMVYNEETGEMEKNGSDFFYVTAGFYLFQFQADKLEPASFNYYTNYVMDPDYCKLAGVVTIDGAVYTIGNDFYNSIPLVRKYADKYLQSSTIIVDQLLDLSIVDGVTDFSYDRGTGLFYMADAANTLHCFDLNDVYTNDSGKQVVQSYVVDLVGDGSYDVNGLAIRPATAE